jgi:hypothetical protein
MDIELKETLRLINKVLLNPSVGPGEKDHLLKAKRELQEVARSGKLHRRKLYRAVNLIAVTLQGVVDDKAST